MAKMVTKWAVCTVCFVLFYEFQAFSPQSSPPHRLMGSNDVRFFKVNWSIARGGEGIQEDKITVSTCFLDMSYLKYLYSYLHQL